MTSSSATPEKKVVLVVEDDFEFRTLLWRFLAPHYTVHQATNGEEALMAVAEHSPDLLLTDIIMPKLDGLALLHTLRDDLKNNVPAIVLVANALPEDIVAARQLSNVTILPKEDITRETLLELIQQSLKNWPCLLRSFSSFAIVFFQVRFAQA